MTLTSFCRRADYSDLPLLSSMSNGPRDGAADGRDDDQDREGEEEEENGYDYPKPRLPLPPARRTLSELGASSSSNSSSAYSRFSLDSDGGAAACECRRASDSTNHPVIVVGLRLFVFSIFNIFRPSAAASLAEMQG